MKPLPHQIDKAAECFNVLKKHGIVYLAGEPRSGKTLTSILVAEKTPFNKILVLTKKGAIDGWISFRDNTTKFYHITNYEQASKLNKNEYDLLILDEAHNLGAVGKPSKRVQVIRNLCYDKPAILLSGTPHAETKASLYHQMCVTKYSPFDAYKSFYKFFDMFGIVETKWIAGRQLKEYKKTKPILDKIVKPYFVTMTQSDAGIVAEQTEHLHYIELDEYTKSVYNKLLRDQIAEYHGEEIVCDSIMKLRMTLHQIEFCDNTITYIHNNFKGKVALMSHFREQQRILSEVFPDFDIYSSNKHKEGVDLSQYDHFVIVSQDYSGSGHIQRRERNVNVNNKESTNVHYLLVKGGISEQVYNTCSQKKDYNNQVFIKHKKELQ